MRFAQPRSIAPTCVRPAWRAIVWNSRCVFERTMYRKAVDIIFDPYPPSFRASIWTDSQDLFEKISRSNKSLKKFFSEEAAHSSVNVKVGHWYKGKDPSYDRKHKIPSVRRHIALLHRIFLDDGEFSPEDVDCGTLKNMQKTFDNLIRASAGIHGMSDLPVFSHFVLLALVVLEKTGLCEATEKDLDIFVYENLVPVLHNLEEFRGTSSQVEQILSWSLTLAKCLVEVIRCKDAWEEGLFDARERISDREVGDEKLNLLETDEDKILFDEQEKSTWIKLARTLCKGRLPSLLREARFEHLTLIVQQRYSESIELSTEQDLLLSYLSCQKTETGITLRRCVVLVSVEPQPCADSAMV